MNSNTGVNKDSVGPGPDDEAWLDEPIFFGLILEIHAREIPGIKQWLLKNGIKVCHTRASATYLRVASDGQQHA